MLFYIKLYFFLRFSGKFELFKFTFIYIGKFDIIIEVIKHSWATV